MSVAAFHDSVRVVGVIAVAVTPFGAVGAVVSCQRHQRHCAWLTVDRVRPELIAIARRICRRFTMPPFVPSGCYNLDGFSQTASLPAKV